MSPRRRLEKYLHERTEVLSRGTYLAQRAALRSPHQPYGRALTRLSNELQDDLNHMRVVLSALCFLEHAPLRETLAWLEHRALSADFARWLTDHSSISRIRDLEELIVVAADKCRLWEDLESIQEKEPSLSRFDFAKFRVRSSEQHRQLVELREQAFKECFVGEAS